MTPIYDAVTKDQGFDPRYESARPMREFIAWWYSKGELGI